MKMSEIKKRQAELKELVKREGESALKEAFDAMFAAHPEVLGVRWTQWTPHFNDGEPCRFSVHDFHFKIQGAAEDCGEYEDGFESIWSLESDYSDPKPTKEQKKLAKALSKFEEEVSDKETMRFVFGDGYEITATREGFDVREREHD